MKTSRAALPNPTDVIACRIAKLEKQVVRLRVITALLVGAAVLPAIVSSASAMEQWLSVGDLSATHINASDIRTSTLAVGGRLVVGEIVASKLTIQDYKGVKRASFGMNDVDPGEVDLTMSAEKNGRSASLVVGRSESRLTLSSGATRPEITMYASSLDILPAGLTMFGGGKPRAEFELRGGDDQLYPVLTLDGTDGQPGIYFSTMDGAAQGSLLSKGGEIELGSYPPNAEPLLRIRSAKPSSAEVRFGVQNGEPIGQIFNGAGDPAWQPKFKESKKVSKTKSTHSGDPL